MNGVDITPSWAVTSQICVEVLQNADNQGAKDEARNELVRMGALLDDLIKNRKGKHNENGRHTYYESMPDGRLTHHK